MTCEIYSPGHCVNPVQISTRGRSIGVRIIPPPYGDRFLPAGAQRFRFDFETPLLLTTMAERTYFKSFEGAEFAVHNPAHLREALAQTGNTATFADFSLLRVGLAAGGSATFYPCFDELAPCRVGANTEDPDQSPSVRTQVLRGNLVSDEVTVPQTATLRAVRLLQPDIPSDADSQQVCVLNTPGHRISETHTPAVSVRVFLVLQKTPQETFEKGFSICPLYDEPRGNFQALSLIQAWTHDVERLHQVSTNPFWEIMFDSPNSLRSVGPNGYSESLPITVDGPSPCVLANSELRHPTAIVEWLINERRPTYRPDTLADILLDRDGSGRRDCMRPPIDTVVIRRNWVWHAFGFNIIGVCTDCGEIKTVFFLANEPQMRALLEDAENRHWCEAVEREFPNEIKELTP